MLLPLSARQQVTPPLVSGLRFGGIRSPIIPKSAPVEVEYFQGAILIGDSLAEGFFLSRSIETMEVISKIGQSAQGVLRNRVYTYQGRKVHLIDILKDKQPKVLYIWLGSNGIDKYTPAHVIPQYEAMLDLFIQELPSTAIICLAVAPVIQQRAQRQYPKMTNQRIQAFNGLMYEAAKARNIYYLPIADVLSDENGGLDKNLSAGDGIHLSREGYQVVSDYLRTRALPISKEGNE